MNLNHLLQLGTLRSSFVHQSLRIIVFKRLKSSIDYSKFPTLKENDIEETYVRGSGPGGQAVNKTANCVNIKHTPTGIIVKCHSSRSLSENRKTARQLLLHKLDNALNREHSVEAQQNAIAVKKITEHRRRQKKIDELKKSWKERELKE